MVGPGGQQRVLGGNGGRGGFGSHRQRGGSRRSRCDRSGGCDRSSSRCCWGKRGRGASSQKGCSTGSANKAQKFTATYFARHRNLLLDMGTSVELWLDQA